ncbi:MAG: hypothetical protein AB2L21_03350 [Anaerolineaceae bacterium]
MKKRISVLVFTLIFLMVSVNTTQAQNADPYQVSLRRDFGYGNGVEIQGNMTLSLKGDTENAVRVTFLMDKQTLAVLESAPYQFSFSTDNYRPGAHSLSAQVETKDGKTFTTKALAYHFLSAEEASNNTKNILIPLLGVAALAIIISASGQFKSNKKVGLANGQPKVYGGLYGGAVCPKCGHPFQRSAFGMNLVTGRLERCPACGKFILTVRASAEQLATAEETEKSKLSGWSEPLKEKDEIADQLEESKYIDLDEDRNTQ